MLQNERQHFSKGEKRNESSYSYSHQVVSVNLRLSNFFFTELVPANDSSFNLHNSRYSKSCLLEMHWFAVQKYGLLLGKIKIVRMFNGISRCRYGQRPIPFSCMFLRADAKLPQIEDSHVENKIKFVMPTDEME